MLAFQAKFGHLELHFMRVGGRTETGWCCYDVVRQGIATKEQVWPALCRAMGLDLSETVAAGDSANDVGMLKAAGLGCCMANGSPTPKAPPTGSSGMCGRTAWPP